MSKMTKTRARLNAIDKQEVVEKEVKNFLRQNKNIVYGVRSINAQANILTRPTADWDAYSKTPEKSANQLQKRLDKLVKGDYFYHKPAKHKGTWKVKTFGNDLKKNTEDDEEIADFSVPDKNYPFTTIDGIRYRKLKFEMKAKASSLKDKEMKFRHEKDRNDLNRIKANLKIKELLK